jgi:membrane protein YdbS with pleckstrin-like domain
MTHVQDVIEPGPPRARAEPSEQLDPRSRQVWMIGNLAGAVISTAIVAVILFLLDRWLEFSAGWVIGVPATLFLAQVAWAFVRPEIEFRQWRYEIRVDEVDLLHGVITRTRQVVPMSRIQHVDTERGPLQRRYGLATVKFFTAAGAMEIPQLSAERADAVRDQIAALAKVHDDL